MANSKKRIVVMLSFLALLFVFVIGISYAYYAAEVKGNNATDPSLKLTSGYLSIVYDGTSSSITGGSTSGTTTDLVYTKNFTVTNDGAADSNFGVWIKNYKVVDKEGNATTFTRPEDWTYTLKSGDTIIKSGTFPTSDEALISVYPLSMNETKNLTLTVTYNYIISEEGAIDQTADMGKVLSFNITVTQAIDKLNDTSEGTLLYALNDIYQASIVRNESDLITIPGKEASLESEAIFATTEDDYGTSYYFRGKVQNNYVNYSGMCWRIVRVDGNGNIKIVLADSTTTCNTSYSLENTNALTEISESTLNTENIVESEWCKDYTQGDILDTLVVDELELYTAYKYGSLMRLENNTPTLKCNFSGAQKTKSYIGGITADETIFAGNSTTSYLNTNVGENLVATISPSWYGDENKLAHAENSRNWYLYINNGVLDGAAYDEKSLGDLIKERPMIVLKNSVLATTDSSSTYAPGTYQNPFNVE